MDDIQKAEARRLFTGPLPLSEVAKTLGVGRDRLRRFWGDVFGDEAVRARGNAARGRARSGSRLKGEGLARAREKGISQFRSTISLKKVAKEVGVHSTVLRRWWKEEFGELALFERARRLQRTNTVGVTGPRKLKKTRVSCSECGVEFETTLG